MWFTGHLTPTITCLLGCQQGNRPGKIPVRISKDDAVVVVVVAVVVVAAAAVAAAAAAVKDQGDHPGHNRPQRPPPPTPSLRHLLSTDELASSCFSKRWNRNMIMNPCLQGIGHLQAYGSCGLFVV